MPENYRGMDWRRMKEIREKYPELYLKITEMIENDWEKTIELIEEGMNQKRIKAVPIPILKAMIEAAMENFISRESLINNNISYEEALNTMIDIIFEGICIN